EAECRPTRSVVISAQLAAMPLDDGATDGESHPQSVGLGRVEWLKDLRPTVVAEAHARVDDLDDHPTLRRVALNPRFDLDHLTTFGRHLHCLQCVDEQIDDDLLELNEVAGYGG